jgi:hypothetical protein
MKGMQTWVKPLSGEEDLGGPPAQARKKREGRGKVVKEREQ